MHFYINKNDFLMAISTVEKFVPSKTPIPILMGIKFELDDGGSLHLSATDENMGIYYSVEKKLNNIHSVRPGAAVVPAKLLSEMSRKLPQGNVEFRQDEGRMHIIAGAFNMVLPCLEEANFPSMSQDGLKKVLTYSQKTFKDMIRKTLFATSEDNPTRPQLSGILLEAKGGVLNAVALDGYRISWRWENIDGGSENFHIIIPGNTLAEVSRIFTDDEESFDLRFGKNQVEFVAKNYTIYSSVLDGSFIDYEKVTAISPNTFVKINKSEILSAVERANLIAREGSRNSLFHLNISQVDLEVEADSDMGSIKDRHSCNISGDSLQISFNARFFIEALKTMETEDVSMNFSGDSGPCIMKPLGKDNHLNYVLPVKIRRSDSY